MNIWWLILILSFIFVGGAAFLYVAVRLNRIAGPKTAKDYQNDAETEVEHIFNDEFRQELRNRGRLHFEKILGESAMFLQQDLRLTTSQLNDYMKGEISKELKDAFTSYQSAIGDAKQMAVESLEKTKQGIDEQRDAILIQLEKEMAEEKARRITKFDENMADVVNHYVLAAIGNQIDLNDQLEYIIGELESHKKEIVEDVINGA